MTMIKLQRAYVEPEADDGFRILVDRLWPRGRSKEQLKLDLWAKSITPSPDLRKAWHHDPARFEEFAEHYRQELNQNPSVDEFLELLSAHPKVTFVFGAKNELINHAVILRDYLLEQLQADQ